MKKLGFIVEMKDCKDAADLRRWVDLMQPDRSPDHMRFGLGLECRLRAARISGGTA